MELNERIKIARKAAGYKSRDALADFLGSTRDAIASYELGRVVPNDVFLQLMATKLNLSYEWLKNGTGNMEVNPSSVDAIIEKLDTDDLEIVKIYAELPFEHKKILKHFAKKIASTQTEQMVPAPSPAFTPEELAIYEKVKAAKERARDDASFDEETAAFHRQLDMEREAEKRGVLASSSGSSDTASLIGRKILAASPSAQAQVSRIIEEDEV